MARGRLHRVLARVRSIAPPQDALTLNAPRQASVRDEQVLCAAAGVARCRYEGESARRRDPAAGDEARSERHRGRMTMNGPTPIGVSVCRIFGCRQASVATSPIARTTTAIASQFVDQNAFIGS